MSHKRDQADAGFTLVEITIAVLLFALVMGSIYQVYVRGERSQQVGLELAEANQNARSGVDLIARELRSAKADGRRGVRSYAEGRLAGQVVPLLRADELWQHPVLAATFDAPLRGRLLAHLDRVGEHVEWLETVPDGTAHGDACTNNLLVQAGSDDLVLIDFGFWSTQPIGFDLGQLLLGDVQSGRRPAATLPAVEQGCLPAYVDGLRDEGCDLPLDVVRRAHALQMLIFTGFSSFMLEGLLEQPGRDGRDGGGDEGKAAAPDLLEQAAERARIAEFVLDLVDETEAVAAAPAGRHA